MAIMLPPLLIGAAVLTVLPAHPAIAAITTRMTNTDFFEFRLII